MDIDGASHFGVFGLPERHALDPADLDDRHLALQQQLHPDRHTGTGESARLLAERYTARINEAHRVLADPLMRAAHLLTLRGEDPFAEAGGAMPADFLERQFELREALDDIVAAGNNAAAQVMADELQGEIDTEMAGLGKLLDERPDDVAGGVAAARRLRYLTNCHAEAARQAAR